MDIIYIFKAHIPRNKLILFNSIFILLAFRILFLDIIEMNGEEMRGQ